jgi:hypothetical protein
LANNNQHISRRHRAVSPIIKWDKWELTAGESRPRATRLGGDRGDRVRERIRPRRRFYLLVPIPVLLHAAASKGNIAPPC